MVEKLQVFNLYIYICIYIEIITCSTRHFIDIFSVKVRCTQTPTHKKFLYEVVECYTSNSSFILKRLPSLPRTNILDTTSLTITYFLHEIPQWSKRKICELSLILIEYIAKSNSTKSFSGPILVVFKVITVTIKRSPQIWSLLKVNHIVLFCLHL